MAGISLSKRIIECFSFRSYRFAYEKWNILLCALYCTDPDKPSIIINPAAYHDLSINVLTMKAVVIAVNSTVVNR